MTSEKKGGPKNRYQSRPPKLATSNAKSGEGHVSGTFQKKEETPVNLH